jgi:5-methyltetrahydrofolate--homocysteine methyltransferase
MSAPLRHTVLRSATKEVVIGADRPFCVIGERINPTGRPVFQAALREGDLSIVAKDVAAQVAGGADVLDINMGVPLTDEAELLVNSVTAEDERLAAVLPLVKKHDAAVVALPNDVDEIPMEAEKRLLLTEKIVRVATEEYGIAIEDIVIDPLAMPIGADSSVGRQTLETIRGIRERWGMNTTCGASNVSFGMPGRHALNATWLSLAMATGMTSAIMDARTPQVVDAVRAADLLLGNDEWGMSWIATHRARQTAEAAAGSA